MLSTTVRGRSGVTWIAVISSSTSCWALGSMACVVTWALYTLGRAVISLRRRRLLEGTR